jgi:hypothetical protein
MDISNNNWDSKLQYVVSLFNVFYNKNITKLFFKAYSIFAKKMEKKRKITINDEILSSPSTLMFETKVLKIP